MLIGTTPGGPFRHDVIDRNFALGMFLNLGWIVQIIEAGEFLRQKPPKFGPLLCLLSIANQRRRIARSTRAFVRDHHRHRARPAPIALCAPSSASDRWSAIAKFRGKPDRFRSIACKQQWNRLHQRVIQFRLHRVGFSVVHDMFAAPQCTDDTDRFGTSVPAFLPVRPFTGRGEVQRLTRAGAENVAPDASWLSDENASATIAGL